MDNGLITKIWGPAMWMSLHSISFGYPVLPSKEDKENYKKYFESIGNVLPCIHCKKSYNMFIKEGDTKLTDDVFESRESLTNWVYKIHQAVNNKLNVDYCVSFSELQNKYETFRVGDDEKKKKAYTIVNQPECIVIPFALCKQFLTMSIERGLRIDDLYIIKKCKAITNIAELKNDIELWNKRNKECKLIVDNMRTSGISSIETDGKYKGLPTINELKLIMRLCSNMPINKLRDISNSIDKSDKQKKYIIFR